MLAFDYMAQSWPLTGATDFDMRIYKQTYTPWITSHSNKITKGSSSRCKVKTLTTGYIQFKSL